LSHLQHPSNTQEFLCAIYDNHLQYVLNRRLRSTLDKPQILTHYFLSAPPRPSSSSKGSISM